MFAYTSCVVFALAVAGVKALTCEQELYGCRAQVLTSRSPLCENIATFATCVSGKGDKCALEETNGVTFESLINTTTNNCAVLEDQMSCFDFLFCAGQKAELQRLIQNDTDVLKDVVKTGFWCHRMEAILNCAIKNDQKCHIDEKKTASIVQHLDTTKEVCRGGAGTMQLAPVLILSAAVLLLQLISS